MSHDKDNLRDLNGRPPIVEIKEHPPELMELDEETVAIARAKLAGLDFDDIYGDEDRSSPELMIRTQAQKIRDLFQTVVELKLAFSSEQKIAQARRDMMIDGINLEFVKNYCSRRQLSFSSDAEYLILIGFEHERSEEANV